MLLEESERPGELMPIEEDEMGTYILNSKDLRAVEHVQRLVRIGVDSLKIEGRTKSHYYVSRATQAYRLALDDAIAGRPFQPRLIGELEGLASRGYTDGFYQRHETRELQNYRSNSSDNSAEIFVGELMQGSEDRVLVEVKNRFALGDRLRLVRPSGNLDFVLERMWDANGQPVEVAPGSGYRVQLALPGGWEPFSLLTRRIESTPVSEVSLARDALASDSV